MKKILTLALALVLAASVLVGCGGGAGGSGGVSLRVVTSYGADDGNRGNYEEGVKAWEESTGNTIKDESAMSNEEWKAKVLADFETGSEPDVLFFFSGVDSNSFVSDGKVVSLDEIRKEYPTYASNMDDGLMNPSPVDGKIYAVPTSGYWEGLYVNKKVLDACGLTVPDANTTWDEFLAMCETIKENGYTPIAASMNEVPHYWFEFCVLNNGNKTVHETLPTGPSDPIFTNWVNGLEDIKYLYDHEYFPANTNTAKDEATMSLMAQDKAAFAIDGSWKMGWFAENAENIDDFTVTYVPGKGQRPSTDIIGGLSMGFYITKKAWDDPAKREAAINFIEHMTSDDMVNKFAGGTAVTALKAGTQPPADANSMVTAALAMLKGATSIVPAVQDQLTGNAKQVLLPDNMKKVITGEITPEASIEEALSKMA